MGAEAQPTQSDSARDGGQPQRVDGRAADQASRRVGRLLRVLVPSSAIVGILYFYGRVYTRELYREFGVDSDGLGFSTPQYLVGSVNVIVDPIAVIALVLVLGALTHRLLVRVAGVQFERAATADSSDMKAATALRALPGSLIVLGVAAMLIFFLPSLTGVEEIIADTFWLLGALAATYGGYLGWRFARLADEKPDEATETSEGGFLRDRGLDDSDQTLLATLLILASVLLIVHGVFELTHSYASERGRMTALWVEQNCSEYPQVRLVSTVDLHLEHLDIAHESTEAGGGFGHLYSGLRRFNHENGYYLLWPTAASPRDGMIIVREDDRVRVDPILLESSGSCPRSARS